MLNFTQLHHIPPSDERTFRKVLSQLVQVPEIAQKFDEYDSDHVKNHAHAESEVEFLETISKELGIDSKGRCNLFQFELDDTKTSHRLCCVFSSDINNRFVLAIENSALDFITVITSTYMKSLRLSTLKNVPKYDSEDSFGLWLINMNWKLDDIAHEVALNRLILQRSDDGYRFHGNPDTN